MAATARRSRAAGAYQPLVSVCIPTRDRAHWLGEALHSVFRQTLQDFEVVVYDDASTDATGDVVERFDATRVRYLRHERSVGVARNRNACLSVARGRYVAWLDSDDRYLPHMLALQVAALEARPRAAFAHGAFAVIDAHGRQLPDWPLPYSRDTVEPGRRALEELVTRNYVGAPTVVVRRSAHSVAGPYCDDLPSGEDWDMWLRLSLVGDVVYTTRTVAQYRWHSGSLARSAEARDVQLRRDLRLVDGMLARNSGRIPRAAALRRRAGAALAGRALLRATDCLIRRERRRALGVMALALRARPGLACEVETWRAVVAAVAGDEYGWHVASRALLRRLASELRGSRLAARLLAATPTLQWQETLRHIARTVATLVPEDARVAAADKWDPTLLHLARRRGWHFPDRQLLPDGYPRDSFTAVDHLQELRRRGAEYLVLPCASFWWLDHYPGLARYLAASGERLWEDERCIIFHLARGGRPTGAGREGRE